MIGRSLLVALIVPAAAAAQRRPGPKAVPEGRVDAFVGRTTGVQGAVGAVLDAGTYVRLAIDVGAGAERRPGGAVVGAQRVEATFRYYVDPFRQTGIGAYFAGGLALRHSAGANPRAALVALVGVEGRPRRGTVTAVEAGVGGGARVGLVLRRARRTRR